MSNDAMMIAIDRIRFTWTRSKKMRVYAVGIAADNLGKVIVTEPPSVSEIRHRPKKGRPSEWDFAGDGYPIYQRTGGLPDIIVAHLLVIRDRSGMRRAGEIISAVKEDRGAQDAIGKASELLKSAGTGGLAAASALALLLPVASAVGTIISQKRDEVLQTISGSMFLDAQRKSEDFFTQTIRSPDNNMEVEADVFLFDGANDQPSVADTANAETTLDAQGLLFVKPGA
ncbi:MAG TPA: hypothetical protein VF339_12610 [Gammaproteobacteria bacterium]